MVSSRKKVLFIGIDGAPFDLVMKWAKRGELPNIDKLLTGGAYGVLKSQLDVTPPAWSSIYTGKNAGKHGIFDFMHNKLGTYNFVPSNSTMRNSKDVWQILSDHGLKVCVLNAPLTFPVRPVNGYLVSGFLTPGEGVSYTYPKSLKDELKAAVPGFHPSSANELQLNLNKDAYVKTIEEELENIRKASLYL
ncbi:MAG: alkaline phosphatase family protein, partial [Nitrososphaerales archaeon]